VFTLDGHRQIAHRNSAEVSHRHGEQSHRSGLRRWPILKINNAQLRVRKLLLLTSHHLVLLTRECRLPSFTLLNVFQRIKTLATAAAATTKASIEEIMLGMMRRMFSINAPGATTLYGSCERRVNVLSVFDMHNRCPSVSIDSDKCLI